MIDKITEFVTDGYNIGFFIGILIWLFMLKLIYLGILWIYIIVEDAINWVFGKTKYAEKVARWLRIGSNILERGKFTDPKKDLWGDLI